MKPKPQPEFIRGEFFIRGEIPSKKNGKMLITRDGKGNTLDRPRTITNPTAQSLLRGIELQAKAAWRGKPTLTNAYIELTFHVSHLAADMDNKCASCCDSFVKAGILRTDSMKHVRREVLEWVLVRPDEIGVMVRIRGEAYYEKPRTSRRAA